MKKIIKIIKYPTIVLFSIISIAAFFKLSASIYKLKSLQKYISNLKDEIQYYKTREDQFLNFKKKRNINILNISNTAIKFIIEDLEGGSLGEKKAFYGCGGYLSIGPEYVFRYNDLNNRGIFFEAGFDIRDYLSKDFIKFLKRSYKGSLFKKNQSLIKILKTDYHLWESQNAMLKALSEADGYKLFKTIINHKVKTLTKNIKIKLTQWEYDALIMAIYNLGGTNLINSDIFKYINKKDLLHAACALASVRNIRYNRSYPILWKNGSLAENKILYFMEIFENSKFFLNSLLNHPNSKNIMIEKKSLELLSKSLDRISFEDILSGKEISLNQDSQDNIIFKDELIQVLKLKNIEDSELKYLLKRYNSMNIFKFIKNFWHSLKKIFKSKMGYECYIWEKNKISLYNLVHEIIKQRRITLYSYGWLKRDFLQSNIFLKKLYFSAEDVNRYSKINHFNIKLKKFWYLLKNGKHKDWIFDKYHETKKNFVGITILYNKYFQNLKQEFLQKELKY